MAVNSFAVTHEVFWKKIVEGDPAEIARKTGVLFDKERKIFRIRIINESYIVDLENKTIITESEPQSRIKFELMVVVVTYLTLGDENFLSGEWVSGQMLPGGYFF